MANAGPSVDTTLPSVLHKLAAIEPRPAPIVSLYVDLAADAPGRDAFLRKAVAEQTKALETQSAKHAGIAGAFQRIEAALADHAAAGARAAAIFAATDDDTVFTAIPLDTPVGGHQLFIGPVPHLYPLARLIDQNPRYAALLLDSNRARIIVFGLGAVTSRDEVSGEKTRRHSMGGWSQARYQRRTENIHLQHLKEVVETLDGVVRDEAIDRVIVAGDAALVARLREQLPAPLAAKIVDVLRLDRHAGEDEIIDEALTALRHKDAEDDGQRVAEVLGAWRGAGLGVAGPEATLRALELGQVDELLITAAPDTLKPVQSLPDDAAAAPSTVESSPPGGADVARLHLSDELVTRATQTGAAVRMIEDPELLRDHGGVAAALRFRV
jgi:hypothetical protein